MPALIREEKKLTPPPMTGNLIFDGVTSYIQYLVIYYYRVGGHISRPALPTEDTKVRPQFTSVYP